MKRREFVVGRARKALDAWRWECLLSGSPYLQANLSAGQIYAELRSPWALTRRLWWRLHQALEGEETLYRAGDSFWLDGIASRQAERRANEILECIKSCMPEVDESFDIPPEFQTGRAECVWNEGFENELVEGQSYEIREIATWLGTSSCSGQETHLWLVFTWSASVSIIPTSETCRRYKACADDRA